MKQNIDDLTFNEAMDLILKHQTKPPVDILAIVHEFKIKVYRTKDWPDSLNGQIVKDKARGGESGYAIIVNATHQLVRQRFTIAHELAHFILHRKNIGDGITDNAFYRSSLSNKEEAMANELAAEILMPWSHINIVIDQGKKNIPELAKSLCVSEGAMSIRLGIPC